MKTKTFKTIYNMNLAIAGTVQLIKGVKKFVPENKNLMPRFLENIAIGKEVKAAFSERKLTRSEKQNAIYWVGVVQPIVNQINKVGLANRMVNKNEVHHDLKEMFLPSPPVKKRIDGVFYTPAKTTTQLRKQEFTDYIERIINWSAKNIDLVIDLETLAPHKAS